MPRLFYLGIVLSLVLLSSRPAFAVLPYLDTDTAIPVDRGKSRLDSSLEYVRYNSNESSNTLRADLTYGLINNLDFTVDVPYIFLKDENASNERGLGDLVLKSKIRFIKGREATPVSIAGELIVKFPSCDDNKALSPECTGEPDVGIRAIASKEFFPVTVHLNLGYVFVGNPPNTTLDDIVQYSVAFDYLTTAEYLHVVGELTGNTNRYPDVSGNPLSALAGLLYEVDMTKIITLATSFGLTTASPDFTLSVGFRYLF